MSPAQVATQPVHPGGGADAGEPTGPTSAASAPNAATPSSVLTATSAQPAPLDLGIPLGTPTSGASAMIAGGKPTIQSADGRFSAAIHAVMQLDMADYMQKTPGSTSVDFRRGATAADTSHARDLSSGSDFRRARLGLDGRVFGDFDYNVLLEFGGTGEEDAGHIQELWVQYSGLHPLYFRVGAFAPFIGLEDANSTNGMPFLERPAPSDLARGLAGSDFREAAQITYDDARLFLSGAVTGRSVGIVNASGSGVAQPYDSQLGFVGRAAFIPFKGPDWLVHLGAHGSWVARPADAGGPDATAATARYAVDLRIQSELRVDATRLIDTGAIDASHASTAGLEFAAQKQNFYLQSELEYLTIQRRVSTLADPKFFAWYVEGSWLLTGERRVYNTGNFAFDAPKIAHNFSVKDGGWGAFELALRYSDADLNFHAGSQNSAPVASAVRGGDETIFTTGLNWYLNPVVRFMFDYQFVRLDRLSPSAGTFLTPAGAQIGQRYSAFAIRSQFAF